MWEFLKALLTTNWPTILLLAGVVFLGLAILGSVPKYGLNIDKSGRVGGAIVGTLFVLIGLYGYRTNPRTLSADQLLRYTTFAVSGTFQQGYSFGAKSTVIIDTETGLEIDANVTVVGPTIQEDFTAKPYFDTNDQWQWQNQGAKGGSLDLRNKPQTFVGYKGGTLEFVGYSNPAIGHGITSANTTFRPIATSNTPSGSNP